MLPSYGMTECMPATTPELSYALERPGTSGVSVGPDILIVDGETKKRLPAGAMGHIALRGAPLFTGYESAQV